MQNFLQWLPGKFEEFQNKTLEEIATTLNQLAETDEGKQTIETLWNTFLDEDSLSTGLFSKGGKLNYLVSLHKRGGTLRICECGCSLHKVMEDGGVVEKCSCGCKITKSENGSKNKKLVKKLLQRPK